MQCVYLIESNGKFKIGVTKDCPQKRLTQLQTSAPDELNLITVYKSDRAFKIEKSLHHLFSHKNCLNEWFDLNHCDIINFHDYCRGIEERFELLETHNSWYQEHMM